MQIQLTTIVTASCRLLAACLYRAAPIVASTLDLTLEHFKNTSKHSTIWPILRGLLFSISVLLILIPLLASADSLFADQLLSLGRWFNPEQIFETLWRLNRAGFVAWLALGGLSFALTVKPFALKRHSEDLRPPRLCGACQGLPADPPPGLRPLSRDPKIWTTGHQLLGPVHSDCRRNPGAAGLCLEPNGRL